MFLLVILSVCVYFLHPPSLSISQRGSCSPPLCESVRVCVCDFCIVCLRDLGFVWDFQIKSPEEAGKGRAFL